MIFQKILNLHVADFWEQCGEFCGLNCNSGSTSPFLTATSVKIFDSQSECMSWRTPPAGHNCEMNTNNDDLSAEVLQPHPGTQLLFPYSQSRCASLRRLGNFCLVCMTSQLGRGGYEKCCQKMQPSQAGSPLSSVYWIHYASPTYAWTGKPSHLHMRAARGSFEG